MYLPVLMSESTDLSRAPRGIAATVARLLRCLERRVGQSYPVTSGRPHRDRAPKLMDLGRCREIATSGLDLHSTD